MEYDTEETPQVKFSELTGPRTVSSEVRVPLCCTSPTVVMLKLLLEGVVEWSSQVTETGRVRPDTRQERVVGVPGVTSLLITSTSRGVNVTVCF